MERLSIPHDEKSRLDEHLQETAKKLQLSEASFHVVRACDKGENYLGIVYRVTIEGQRNGKKEIIKTIFKCAPWDESRRELLHSTSVFLREIFFYEEVLPIFSNLLREHGMRLQHFPTLYTTSNKPAAEVLVLDDLTSKGYRMNANRILDYEHASLILRCLGQFHACSFAIRATNPSTFQKLREMEEPLFREKMANDPSAAARTNAVSNVVARILAEEGSHYVERFNAFAKNVNVNMIDATDSRAAEPYAVVNHGDAWTNNMLFKYSQDTGKKSVPVDLQFIDFQLSRYASPVLDLVYVLFCCCTGNLRRKYYDKLLHEYHDALSDYLRQLDCDASTLFPYDVLLTHLKRFGKFGAGMALYVLHIFTDSKKQVTEIKVNFDESEIEERVREDEIYRTMLRDTFKDFVDKEYL